jgi:eukaryotic-like serine/threonine-protein kinase
MGSSSSCIQGPDLGQLLCRRRRPFPVDQVLRWGSELLAVLEYLHSHVPPVIHRDVKPANIKIGGDGRLILLDFGRAKGSVGGMTRGINSRTVASYSPHYAPLEQLQI